MPERPVELPGLQAAEFGDGPALRVLVHFLVAIEAVEFEREFVVGHGVERSAFSGLELKFAFEDHAALDVPSGVKNDIETLGLELTKRIEFLKQIGSHGFVAGLFAGAGAGESFTSGVGGGGLLALSVRGLVERWALARLASICAGVDTMVTFLFLEMEKARAGGMSSGMRLF